MNLVSQAELARKIGVSRQSILNAINRHSLRTVLDDKRRKIDLDDKLTKIYISAANKERHNIMQSIGHKKKGKKNIEKKEVRPIGNKKRKKIDKIENDNMSAVVLRPDENQEAYDYEIKYLIARSEKEQQMVIEKKLKNAKIRGELLDREAVYKIFLYLDKVHSNLERLSSSYLNDVGGDIVTAGHVTPEIDERWRTAVLEQIDDAKKEIIKKLKDIDKDQAG